MLIFSIHYLIYLKNMHLSSRFITLQCFDTVGWVTGRASGCWFVGGDDFTGALHDL